MTLPTAYSWSEVGERLVVPYVAPQGRRVNAIGAYFSHGPMTGEFRFACLAKLPERSKRARQPPEQQAARHGLSAEEVGIFDSEVFLSFAWELAGRPKDASPTWRRCRPLFIAIDNYSVHKSEAVQAALPDLAAAGIHLWYLPSYSPELSEMEPIWQDVKYHGLPTRSFERLGDLLHAAEHALTRKAIALRAANPITDHLLPMAA